MKTTILLIIDLLAVLFFVTSLTVFLGNFKATTDGLPKLFKNQFFLLTIGFCMLIVIILFAMGTLMWEQPIQQYEQVIEPLYRLKH